MVSKPGFRDCFDLNLHYTDLVEERLKGGGENVTNLLAQLNNLKMSSFNLC